MVIILYLWGGGGYAADVATDGATDLVTDVTDGVRDLAADGGLVCLVRRKGGCDA